MFERVFSNLDDTLRQEQRCSTELDYIEQTSWLLFLKYLDDLESDRCEHAILEGNDYIPILEEQYRWSRWACPKDATGEIDHKRAATGDDLVNFVNLKLWPYLKGFHDRASGANTIEYKIGEIFNEISCKFQDGYILRAALNLLDSLEFRLQDQKHELSELYESRIKRMGNAGRNGGEYYTPRPLIRAMVRVIDPKIGETIYDGACGSCGFLCEAYDYIRLKKLTGQQLEQLESRTLFGREKKSLAYIVGVMNMILHGIHAPNIVHTNTLAQNIADIQEKDRFDIVLANPPFGGQSEVKQIQNNFPIKSGETAYMFLQHFIKSLKAGGRAAVVIKSTFLSTSDNASISLRQELLNNCNLHTVLDCPGGTFQGAGVKTVVLFFEKGTKTKRIWYYELDLGRNLGKTNALNDDDLEEFVQMQKKFTVSDKSWVVKISDLEDSCDLSVRNPNRQVETVLREPKAILSEMQSLDAEAAQLLSVVRGLL